jgi:hypothetical protein
VSQPYRQTAEDSASPQIYVCTYARLCTSIAQHRCLANRHIVYLPYESLVSLVFLIVDCTPLGSRYAVTTLQVSITSQSGSDTCKGRYLSDMS